jgi:hypothetical protein
LLRWDLLILGKFSKPLLVAAALLEWLIFWYFFMKKYEKCWEFRGIFMGVGGVIFRRKPE